MKRKSSSANTKSSKTRAAKPVRKSPSYPGVVRGPVANARSEPGTELPHERDETTGPSRGKRSDPRVGQALKDVESGRVDTDLRGTAVGVYKRAGRASKVR